MCTFQELSSGCMLCWEVIPIKIPTTRKGLCGWFLMCAMCVATSMPVFYSPFTHPTSPRMLSLFLPSTSSQIAPSPKGKADPITVLLKTLQWQPFSLRVKSSGHSSPTFPLTQWVPTALPTHCSSNTTRTFLPLCPGSRNILLLQISISPDSLLPAATIAVSGWPTLLDRCKIALLHHHFL